MEMETLWLLTKVNFLKRVLPFGAGDLNLMSLVLLLERFCGTIYI